ncbi:MAG: TlpA disulfide reductase family protein [Pirellulales bacterium]
MRTIRFLRGNRWLAGLFPITALLFGVNALLLSTTSDQCRAGEGVAPPIGELPRYQFKVGQELQYTGSSVLEYENGSIKSSTDWKIWVTRKNNDGSWRLVVKTSQGNGDEAQVDDSRSTLAYVDLFPDGRLTKNSTLGFGFEPRSVFAQLPSDDSELKNGWQARSEFSDTTYRYTPKAAEQQPAKLWQIACVQDSPTSKIYLASHEDEITFDREQGIVREIQGKSTQGWGINGKGTSQRTLKDVTESKPEWIASLDRDLDRYLATAKQEEELDERIGRSPEPEPLLDQAKQLWTKLRGEVTNDEVAKVVESKIKQQDSYRTYRIERAKAQAEIVGKPAANWDTTDLDGKPHRLADYAGKVVVLDFWYRGCGWCIRAMPQLNQVAEDFAGQPVALLGMNTDSKLEDAKFVEEAMQLKYRSLRVDDEFPKKYGVSGFPTFIVIDGSGTVRDLHVGYSPTLREKLTTSIRDARKNSATPTPSENTSSKEPEIR